MMVFKIKVADEAAPTLYQWRQPRPEDVQESLLTKFGSAEVEHVDMVEAARYYEALGKIEKILSRISEYCVAEGLDTDDDFVQEMIALGMEDPFKKGWSVEISATFRVTFELSDVDASLDESEISEAIADQLSLYLNHQGRNIEIGGECYSIDGFDAEDTADWDIEVTES